VVGIVRGAAADTPRPIASASAAMTAMATPAAAS
jgi:hypothetical protein